MKGEFYQMLRWIAAINNSAEARVAYGYYTIAGS